MNSNPYSTPSYKSDHSENDNKSTVLIFTSKKSIRYIAFFLLSTMFVINFFINLLQRNDYFTIIYEFLYMSLVLIMFFWMLIYKKALPQKLELNGTKLTFLNWGQKVIVDIQGGNSIEKIDKSCMVVRFRGGRKKIRFNLYYDDFLKSIRSIVDNKIA